MDFVFDWSWLQITSKYGIISHKEEIWLYEFDEVVRDNAYYEGNVIVENDDFAFIDNNGTFEENIVGHSYWQKLIKFHSLI